MLKTFVLALAAVLALSSFVARGQVPHVLGLWELNQQKSQLPAQLFPAGIKSEVRSYYQRDDGYLTVLALRINGNGIPDFIQVTVRSDGNDYPQYQSVPLAEFQINGTPTPFTYSETVTGEYSAEIIAKWNGQVINKGTRQISTDGKTMTLNVAAVQQDGSEVPIVLVFDKTQ